MNRNVGVERLYTLGDYKNIKFANEVVGIPEELANNPKVVELVFAQAYISCEIAYRKYVDMITEINAKYGKDAESVMEFLQEQRTKTWNELYTEISGTADNNEKETV